MSGQKTYRSEFVAALELLAQACGLMRAAGAPLPILVGGAVVEFDTGGAIVSGDFDFAGGDDAGFRAAMLAVGFVQEDRRGRLLRGYYHPDLLIGVELVSGDYFDGRADRQRVRIIELASGEVLAAATEDLIADRLGQWIASRRRDEELLHQALAMARMSEDLDMDYLITRVMQETAGELTPDDLRSLVS